MTLPHWTCAVAFCISLSAGTAFSAAPNGGMEGTYRKGLAPNWEANCYGDCDVRFEADTENPHSGKTAQKIICTRFDHGGVQIRCRGIAVEKGRPYTLEAWLRGDALKGPVLLCIRKHGHPYTKYLAQYVHVSHSWRRFTVVGDASGSDPDCGIYIWFGGTGTLWGDDVSLRSGAHRPQTPSTSMPPVKGNRVYNSSFELGAAGWRHGTVTTPGQDSPHCLQCDPGVTIESRPFVVTPGQLHTVSLYAAASEPRVRIEAEITEYADRGGDRPVLRHSEKTTFAATPQWQRYSFRAVLEAPFTRGYMLRLKARGGPVRIDAVQIEEGGITGYRPAHPVELALDLPILKRYPRPREPVEPKLTVYAPGGPNSLSVTLVWQDFFGCSIPAGTVHVRIGKDDRAETTVECVGQDFGIYRLRATAGAGAAEGELVLGVLPGDDGRRVPDSFFGTHANMDPHSENIGVVLARRAGMRWYRLHDFNHHVQWRSCEPKRRGEYVWADDEIRDLARRGFCLMGTLVRTPDWAGRAYPPDRPAIPQARIPREFAWYADFVRTVVGRYRDVIHHWEMWNEPYGRGFWAGTPEEYVELARLGAKAAREADPTCEVVGMCVYAGMHDWIDKAVAAGGLRDLDILSYHVYISPRLVVEDEHGQTGLDHQVLYLRSVLQGANRGAVPLWDTEGGVPCPSFYSWAPPDGVPCSWHDAAATVPKAVAIMMAQGVRKWFYYFIGFKSGGSGSYYRMNNIAYVQLDIDGSPKPTLLAHAAAARLLDEQTFVARITGRELRGCVFHRDDMTTAILWTGARKSGRDQPVALRLPAALGTLAVFDVMGRQLPTSLGITVGDVPVYIRVRVPPHDLLAVLNTINEE